MCTVVLMGKNPNWENYGAPKNSPSEGCLRARFARKRNSLLLIWDRKLCVRPPQLEECELGEHEWIEMCLRSHQDPAANEFVCSAINDDSYL